MRDSLLRVTFPALLLGALAASASAGERHFVDASLPIGGDGSTWSGAFTALQPALAAAAAGDEIWVAQGAYFGGFVVPAGVELYGGFRSGATRLTQRDPINAPTVLDGKSLERVLVLGNGSLVDGFTVRNGRAGSPGGGGALVDGTSPTIRSCFFTQNSNVGGRGAALHVRAGGQPTVESTYFVGNQDPFSGHVIDIVQSGGLYLGIVVFDNKNNGLHFMSAATPKIYNSIFAKNSGRGVCDITSDDAPIVENNLFFGNGVSLYHYHGQELFTAAAIDALPYAKNNISADPGFVSPASGDYRLAPGSPCIEAGHPSVTGALRDFYGNARRLDGDLDRARRSDIGAHEFAHVTLAAAPTPAIAGGTLQLVVAGTPGLPALVALAVAPSAGLPIEPFGPLFLDPASFLPIASVALPSILVLPVPAGFAGASVAFQAAALSGLAGNTSNLVDVLVQ